MVVLINSSVPLLQVPQQSLQPADVTLEAAEAAAQANVEGVAQTSHRQAGESQMGQPNSHRQKNRLALGGRPVHSPTGSLTQAQKQQLLLKQTQQIRQQSQQVSQQLSQQLPQQLQQQATSQLPQQPANIEQAKQKKQNRHKRKLEGAFGEVRNGEQTPDQAHIMAEEDEQGKRQRELVQGQVRTTQSHKCAVLCCAVLCCAVRCGAVLCCAVL